MADSYIGLDQVCKVKFTKWQKYHWFNRWYN